MRKCKVLWISSCAPVKNLGHAGGTNYKKDFDNIACDERFEVMSIAISSIEAKDKVERELSKIRRDIIYLDHSMRAKIKKIVNLESKLNLWNANAGLMSNFCAAEILKRCRKAANSFKPDVVILEWTNCVVLAPEIRKIFPLAIFVAKEHDVTYIGYERYKEYYHGFQGKIWNIKYKQEKKVELNALKICDVIVPHNPDNREILIQDGISPEKMFWYVPYYQNMSYCKRRNNNRDILFYGAMARKENYLSCIWFIEKVMPLLSDLDVRFVILGSNPTEEVKQYESERVHVTGFVEQVEPFFEESLCLVAPLVLGAGIKIKILEALSSGIPVLTNEIGIEGIKVCDGVEYLHCERPEDYAMNIRRLLMGDIVAETMSVNAKSAMKKYDYNTMFEIYKRKLLEIGLTKK